MSVSVSVVWYGVAWRGVVCGVYVCVVCANMFVCACANMFVWPCALAYVFMHACMCVC